MGQGAHNAQEDQGKDDGTHENRFPGQGFVAAGWFAEFMAMGIFVVASIKRGDIGMLVEAGFFPAREFI